MKSLSPLDQFTDFDTHIDLYIKRIATKIKFEGYHFEVLDSFGNHRLYSRSNNIPVTLKDYFETHHPLTNTHDTLCNTIKAEYNVLLNDMNSIRLLILNPLTEKRMVVTTLSILFNRPLTKTDIKEIIHYLDIHYFEHLSHHLQMFHVNYEKFYYIIDTYTELLINKDKFMPNHMTNVANWCMKIAAELKLSFRDTTVLYVSALIHDIGKLYISDTLINKRTPLEAHEYEELKKHTIKGYEIAHASLYGMTFLQEVPIIIKHHHEHFDGKGYPDGLVGDNIPYLSRIISIADTVDAMMSRRPYKNRLRIDSIIKELVACSGKQFDPIITKKMIKILTGLNVNKSKTTVNNAHFIPQASLSFYYEDIHNIYSVSGNLIMAENSGKLILHSSIGALNKLDLSKIYHCTVSFYNFSDLLEYNVKIDAIANDQLHLSSFECVPIDKYFSIVWDSVFSISSSHFQSKNAQLVKLGGNSIIFETDALNASDLIRHRGKPINIQLSLVVGDASQDMTIEARITKHHNFGNQITFIAKFINISNSKRDQILRMLFKKQIYQKQLKASFSNAL